MKTQKHEALPRSARSSIATSLLVACALAAQARAGLREDPATRVERLASRLLATEVVEKREGRSVTLTLQDLFFDADGKNLRYARLAPAAPPEGGEGEAAARAPARYVHVQRLRWDDVQGRFELLPRAEGAKPLRSRPGSLGVRRLAGRAVHASDGPCGTVKDLLVDPRDMSVRAALVFVPTVEAPGVIRVDWRHAKLQKSDKNDAAHHLAIALEREEILRMRRKAKSPRRAHASE